MKNYLTDGEVGGRNRRREAMDMRSAVIEE